MPILTVIAGPNGSGKSTLINGLHAQGVAFGEYLNADDIARELGPPGDLVSKKAQEEVRARREAALNDGRDHAFETVMSHVSHIDYMLRARNQGFEVRLHFVATEDPVINLDRVSNRVLHGGHDVPENRVIARYHRCLANLPAAINASNYATIYDNSSSKSPMRELAVIGWGILFHAVLVRQYLTLSETPQTAPADPDKLPIWWLEILLQIKPTHPLRDGPLS